MRRCGVHPRARIGLRRSRWGLRARVSRPLRREIAKEAWQVLGRRLAAFGLALDILSGVKDGQRC